MLGKTDAPDGESEKSWLGRNIQTFRDALDDYKGRER
jgi:hypothetical protein